MTDLELAYFIIVGGGITIAVVIYTVIHDRKLK